MRSILILIFLLLSYRPLKAQELIAPAGAFAEKNTGSISWTIGEILTETFGNENRVLNHGFQQGDLSVTTLLNALNFQLKTYPNPVSNVLIIATDKPFFHFRLWDMEGQLVREGMLEGKDKQIKLSDLPAGQYILQTDKLNTHKIIKK
ncbi:MAG: T9SS type A sorting domain-containing protein [Candidatus Cyclobacteriaceae bacterium M3_2C_046]